MITQGYALCNTVHYPPCVLWLEDKLGRTAVKNVEGIWKKIYHTFTQTYAGVLILYTHTQTHRHTQKHTHTHTHTQASVFPSQSSVWFWHSMTVCLPSFLLTKSFIFSQFSLLPLHPPFTPISLLLDCLFLSPVTAGISLQSYFPPCSCSALFHSLSIIYNSPVKDFQLSLRLLPEQTTTQAWSRLKPNLIFLREMEALSGSRRWRWRRKRADGRLPSASRWGRCSAKQ